MNYYKSLIDVLKYNSVEKEDTEAMLKEWNIYNFLYNNQPSNCVCGHPNIFKKYTIQNNINGNILRYVGSCCMEHFNNIEIDMIVASHNSMITKVRKIMNNAEKYITDINKQHDNKLKFGKYSHCSYKFVYERLPIYIDYLKKYKPSNTNMKSFYKYIKLRDCYNMANQYNRQI
jgi:hypothetical protein